MIVKHPVLGGDWAQYKVATVCWRRSLRLTRFTASAERYLQTGDRPDLWKAPSFGVNVPIQKLQPISQPVGLVKKGQPPFLSEQIIQQTLL